MKKYLVRILETGDLVECKAEEVNSGSQDVKEGYLVGTPEGFGTVVGDLSDLGRA